MPPQLDVIEAQILKLSQPDRAMLLDRLILGLDGDQARDQAWDAVAAQEIKTWRVVRLLSWMAQKRWRNFAQDTLDWAAT